MNEYFTKSSNKILNNIKVLFQQPNPEHSPPFPRCVLTLIELPNDCKDCPPSLKSKLPLLIRKYGS